MSRPKLRRLTLRHPHLAAWIALVMVLGLWGTWAGPSWNPQPLSAVLIPETSDTAIGVREPTGQIGEYEVDKSLVEIEFSDHETIQATIRRPIGFEGLAPAMVFIHGTGTQSHTNFEREAQAISSTGIITIVPDKRVHDYSLTHRDYEELAEDFSEVFDYAVGMEGVDPHRSGLYAVSEGCFIAPVVAATNPAVSYIALISAPVLPIREQGAWAADTYLRAVGVPNKVLQAIPRLIGQEFDEETFEYIDFDVSPYQRQLTQPIFMAYGTSDISMPIIQAPIALMEDVAQVGNDSVTIRYYDKANHGLELADHTLVLSAMQDVADWVSGMPYTAHSTPHIAGAKPTQAYVADTVNRASWFASGSMGLNILIGGVALILVSLITSALYALIRRYRRTRMVQSDKAPALPMARINGASLVLLVAVLALLAYIVALAYLATNYSHNSFITYGGWAFLRILALLAAWLCVVAVSRFFARYTDGGEYAGDENGKKKPRLALVVACAAFLGQLTLLLALAYWGVFPSLI